VLFNLGFQVKIIGQAAMQNDSLSLGRPDVEERRVRLTAGERFTLITAQ
jgi:hypothetical protein